MGNTVSSYLSTSNAGYVVGLGNIPNHLLLDIFSYLDTDDLLNCSLVCQKWNYLMNIASNRLRKLHILRISIDCRFIGQDAVWLRDHRNDGTTILVHGSTKVNTQSKIRRLTCDELRICGPKTEDRSLVAVDPTWLTTIIPFSSKTLSRVYIFRANLFRFTERDVSQLSSLSNLTVLSVSGVEEANAFTDLAFEPIIQKGTLEKLVLDHTRVTDSSLALVATFCPKLSLLSVWACYGVTDIGIGLIVQQKLSRRIDSLKIICRETSFDNERFLNDFPIFSYSPSGRAFENAQRKISVHFS